MLEVLHDPYISLPMHRHADARIVVVLSGKITETELGGRKTYSEGEWVFRPPFVVHSNRTLGEGTRYLRLAVSHKVWTEFIDQYGWHTAKGFIDDLDYVVKDLMSAPNGGDVLLKQFFSTDYGPLSTPIGVGLEQLALTLRSSDKLINLKNVAEKLNMRPYQLTRKFHGSFGFTPSEYYREARLQKSIEMLSENNLSLAEIASSCGYADQSHFTRNIHNATGCRPTELRRQLSYL